MELSFIKQLADIAAQAGLQELEYSDGSAHLRLLGRGHPAAAPDARPAAPAAAPSAPQQPQQPHEVPPPPPAANAAHTVRAGLVGTFFRGSAPDQAPFVAVGDQVTEGQTLALVEAMKMLNAVEADVTGRVLQILVEDGTPVEASTPLFTIEPAARDV